MVRVFLALQCPSQLTAKSNTSVPQNAQQILIQTPKSGKTTLKPHKVTRSALTHGQAAEKRHTACWLSNSMVDLKLHERPRKHEIKTVKAGIRVNIKVAHVINNIAFRICTVMSSFDLCKASAQPVPKRLKRRIHINGHRRFVARGHHEEVLRVCPLKINILMPKVHKTCIYSKKSKVFILMPKVHKTCIYSRKSKVLIVKSHKTCIYSKKPQKKKQFVYASESHIESEMLDFFDFFEYMQVWWLFTIKMFDLFEYTQVLCTFGIKMLIFFEYMQVWWTSSLSNLHFCNLKTKTRTRYAWYVFPVQYFS